MDIHKPKPWHNWREFLKEYAIIVLGVATALGAEQALEWVHWQHRIADARATMVLELRDDDGPQAFLRAAAGPCFDRQLNGIRAAVEAGRSRSEIAALIRQYAPPIRSWDSEAWDAVFTSDLASHVTPNQMRKWGLLYVAVPRLNARSQEEREALITVKPVRETSDKLSANEADTILGAVGRLRAINNTFMSGSGFLLSVMARNGIEVTPEQKARILDGLRKLYQNCVVVPSIGSGVPDDQFFTMRNAMQQKTR
ncbi:MAG: hypothetical protein JO256_07400 [Alphaproteobacteria bacterium]|nr:hypothetical protein [Alphaproteobacteria bacterium]